MGCKALAVRTSTQDWSFEDARFIHIYIPYIMLIQKLNKCLTKQRTVAWVEMQLEGSAGESSPVRMLQKLQARPLASVKSFNCGR